MDRPKYIYHFGIRPIYDVREVKLGERFYYIEDATRKIWTTRELNSGCGKKVEYKPGIENLLYCSYCNEWFSPKQFEGL